MPFFQRRVRRVGRNRFRLDLPEAESELLEALVPQLRTLLTTDDPSLRRLFPVAYANDPELDAGYQALARDELLEKRLDALTVMEETLAEQGDLDGDRLSAFMRAANDIRLVLGTRLDVSEESPVPDPESPEGPAYAVYEYLGMLLTLVVDALDADL